MAETKLIRDHHLLTRNLKLNGKYLSNDGGNNGISVADGGNVTVSSDIQVASNLSIADNSMAVSSGDFLLDVEGVLSFASDYSSGGIKGTFQFQDGNQSNLIFARIFTTAGLGAGAEASYLRLYEPNDAGLEDYFSIETGQYGSTTLYAYHETGGSAHLTVKSSGEMKFMSYASEDIVLQPGGVGQTAESSVVIDYNAKETTTSTNTALVIDYDHTEIAASGQTITGVALKIDMNCESITHVGTVNQTAIDIDMTAAQAGTQTNTGLNIYTAGADTNYGIIVISSDRQLLLGYDGSNYADISVADDGHLELATTGTDADLTLDAAGDIIYEAANVHYFRKGSSARMTFDFSNHTTFKFMSSADNGDQLNIVTSDHGATTISTIDDDAAAAHLDFVIDGHLDFNTSACGFTQIPVTFGESPSILDTGNSTDIDFRKGNKAYLRLAGNLGALNDLNLIFPAVSGNFVLVLEQDGTGSRTIHADAWEGNVFTSDASTLANTPNPLWSGGTAPTLTTTADYFDIISFYWDATNGRVFAVTTLNFS